MGTVNKKSPGKKMDHYTGISFTDRGRNTSGKGTTQAEAKKQNKAKAKDRQVAESNASHSTANYAAAGSGYKTRTKAEAHAKRKKTSAAVMEANKVKQGAAATAKYASKGSRPAEKKAEPKGAFKQSMDFNRHIKHLLL